MPPTETHVCNKAIDGVKFCYPRGAIKGSYWVAIDPSVHPEPQKDIELLTQSLGKLINQPTSTNRIPKDVAKRNPGSRIYNVSQAIPQKILERLWKVAFVPGPNCYQAALCASGFDHVCDRYVDSDEASYLLTKFFRPVPNAVCETSAGNIGVFSESVGFGLAPGPPKLGELLDPKNRKQRHAYIPSKDCQKNGSCNEYKDPLNMNALFSLMTYGVGTHMFFSVGFGLAYHKLSYYWNDGYQIDPIVKAMDEVMEASYSHLGAFEGRLARERREKSGTKERIACYQLYKDPKLLYRFNGNRPWQNSKRDYFLQLFRHYTANIDKIVQALKDESLRYGVVMDRFDRERMSLISAENIWNLLTKFREEIGHNRGDILNNDTELAIAYYALDSLKWQYQVMSDTYYRITERDNADKKLRILYSKHYIKLGKDLEDEIVAHLKARDVSPGPNGIVYSRVLADIASQLKKVNPLDSYRSNGSKGVQFYKILEEMITKHSTS